MANAELVMRTDPTPAEIDFLEERLYEFNSKATGIVDALGQHAICPTQRVIDRNGEHLRPSPAGVPAAVGEW